MHFGPTSDPLHSVELEARSTVKILKIFGKWGYPSIITTKFPGVLTRPEYLQALDGLPLVVQCSVSSDRTPTSSRLWPAAKSSTTS